MTATDILREEHDVVLSTLNGMEKIAKNIRDKDEVDHDNIDKFVDFSRNFTDGCHHKKEEHQLFPKMAERGFSLEAGPVGMMMYEHVEGRRLIAETEQNNLKSRDGDSSANKALAESIMGYVSLLRNHINKENDILFGMADNALTPEDQLELLEKFEEVEDETGDEVHNKYLVFARELSVKYGS